MIICDLKLLLFLPHHPCNVILRAICGFSAHCWAPPASQPGPGVATLFPSRGPGRAGKWVHLVRLACAIKRPFLSYKAAFLWGALHPHGQGHLEGRTRIASWTDSAPVGLLWNWTYLSEASFFPKLHKVKPALGCFMKNYKTLSF